MSKFREALKDAYVIGAGDGQRRGDFVIDAEARVRSIASRHGLFFSEREVRGMLIRCMDEVLADKPIGYGKASGIANNILSRHTEGDANKLDPKSAQVLHDNFEELLLDDTPTIKASDKVEVAKSNVLTNLTKRLETIEQRVMADGHARVCDKLNTTTAMLLGTTPTCTCGYDKLRRMRE